MDTILVGPRSATLKELVDQTRTGRVMGKALFPQSRVICGMLAGTEVSTFPDNWAKCLGYI